MRGVRGRDSGLAALVRQRVFRIACGYGDQGAAATERGDPLLKLACGSLPERGLANAGRFSGQRQATAAGLQVGRARELVVLEARLADLAAIGTYPRAHDPAPSVLAVGRSSLAGR